MKTPLFFIFAFTALVFSCGPGPVSDVYSLRFPAPPDLRTELLGESHWRLEYYDSGGNFRQKDAEPGSLSTIKLDLLQEWPNAVLAWPYWPEKNLAAGHFYPAGAVFPLDISGKTINLSWEAGTEAYFFRELEKAQEFNNGTNRFPMYFDWKRFRALLREHDNPELRKDPWLADWKEIAGRTVRSGFRQSYLKAEKRTARTIIVPWDGPWLSASPFRPPEFLAAGGELTLMLTTQAELLVCPAGILSVSPKTLLWALF